MYVTYYLIVYTKINLATLLDVVGKHFYVKRLFCNIYPVVYFDECYFPNITFEFKIYHQKEYTNEKNNRIILVKRLFQAILDIIVFSDGTIMCFNTNSCFIAILLGGIMFLVLNSHVHPVTKKVFQLFFTLTVFSQ